MKTKFIIMGVLCLVGVCIQGSEVSTQTEIDIINSSKSTEKITGQHSTVLEDSSFSKCKPFKLCAVAQSIKAFEELIHIH